MFPAFVEIGSTVEQKTALVLHLSSMSISGGFSMDGCIPCCLMCRYTIVVFIDFSRCFFVNSSVRPGQVFSKPSLIALIRVVVLKIKC